MWGEAGESVVRWRLVKVSHSAGANRHPAAAWLVQCLAACLVPAARPRVQRKTHHRRGEWQRRLGRGVTDPFKKCVSSTDSTVVTVAKYNLFRFKRHGGTFKYGLLLNMNVTSASFNPDAL